MADTAAKGIKKAQQAGQLRKDAAVQGKKSSVGKRNSSSGGGLSSPQSSAASNLVGKNDISTTHSSSGISNIAARNASRRTQNRQTIDKAISIAKKIPVANKYAKMAEKIRAVQKKVQGVSGAIKSKIDGGQQVSKDDVEEAMRAEQNGEEYKPDAAESKYTAITSRQMRNLAIFFLGGIMVGSVFFCVILISSITDSGGQAYLASKENPTEEELEKNYTANEDSESDNSGSDSSASSSSSNSSSNSSSSSSSSSHATVSKTGNQTIDKLNSIAIQEAENKSGAEKFQNWFGRTDDWCGMFVSWLFDQVGGLGKYYVKNGFAGGGARESVSAGYGTWLEDECTDSKTVPKPGDVLHYNHVSGDKYSSGHVGYVYSVDDNKVYTVEGNHDPEKVVTVTYSRDDCQINGYYRPKY